MKLPEEQYIPKPGEWFEFRANENYPWEPLLLIGTDKRGSLVCEPMTDTAIVRVSPSTNIKNQLRAYVPSQKDLWIATAVSELEGLVEVDPEDLVELLEYVYLMLESEKLPKVPS